MKNKFHIETLGCKVNQYESQFLKRNLYKASFRYDRKNPDFIILNSCCVTKTAAIKSARRAREQKKLHPKAKLVLMGCWSKIYPKEAEKLPVDLVWRTGQLEKLVDKIKVLMGWTQAEKINDGLDESKVYTRADEKPMMIEFPRSGESSRYFLKIQDGCEQHCSYCIIPYTRGKLKSRPKKEILDELNQAVSKGYREVVLCGIHLGLYGKEGNSKTCNLDQLLKDIIKIEKLGRVRLSSIEVVDITNELIQTMGRSEKVCDHLHIPLQSGCDKILQMMNRPYDIKYFEKKINKIRRLIPNIAITTDVIVGFPSETDEDFHKTIDLIKKVKFSRLHVFPFSAHEKAPAYNFQSQIPQIVKKQRADQLRVLGKELQREFYNKFTGKKMEIAIEKAKKDWIEGIEEHYFKIKAKTSKIKKGKAKVGSLIEVVL